MTQPISSTAAVGSVQDLTEIPGRRRDPHGLPESQASPWGPATVVELSSEAQEALDVQRAEQPSVDERIAEAMGRRPWDGEEEDAPGEAMSYPQIVVVGESEDLDPHQRVLSGEQLDLERGEAPEPASGTSSEADEAEREEMPAAENPNDLSEDEVELVDKLEDRDTEVRAHEAAHLAAAGGLAQGLTLVYQTGPDGKQYAVGGEVRIDTSEGSTPEETLAKAQTIRTAALAPAEPSSQDRAVAAYASQMEARARQAQQEALAQEAEERESAADAGQADIEDAAQSVEA